MIDSLACLDGAGCERSRFRKPSLTMSRHGRRLVIWLTLAAFLLTNTPGALVAAVQLLGTNPRQHYACQHTCCHACCDADAPESGCMARETAPYPTTDIVSKNHFPGL